VFHVTRLSSLEQILSDQEIRPNTDRSRSTPFGYMNNGFFRNRGCISLFDYRAESTERLEQFRNRCYPFQAAEQGEGGIAILFLKPSVCDRLVPWTRWRDEEAWSEMVVPHVEAGYPGALKMEFVSEIVTLELTEDPESIMAVFRSARAKRLELQKQDQASDG